MIIDSNRTLINYINQGHKVKYLFFWGHQPSKSGVSKSCFSQWYDSPFEVNGKVFKTAEHCMMHAKAQLFNDFEIAEKILRAANPGEAKALGRKVRNFKNDKWVEHRFQIVVDANVAKFSTYPALKNFLLDTSGRILVEASPVDPIWGIGLAADDPAAQDPNRWRGENILGYVLMSVREMLSSE